MKTEEIGKKAALLSVIEVGLGSLLHAFYVPFAGHFLSLNQGFILAWATHLIKDSSTSRDISITASLLKSLSPAGKKLTPMLAIAMQGQLFSLGVKILGARRIGLILGMALLCLWGFIQPAIMYYFLFGQKILLVVQYLMDQVKPYAALTFNDLIIFFICAYALKVLAGILLVFVAQKISVGKMESYERWAKQIRIKKEKRREHSPFIEAFRDMLNPFFLLSWMLTLIFCIFAQSESSETIWMLLRPIALGYLLFLLIRLFPHSQFSRWVQKKQPRFMKSLAEAMKHW
ncbi:MAG: hypothetical protein K2P81_03225 [Bacteriovoracaceae bacterium]|nr:hypothetical protein [Bacteriovoracaceae bacterium]